MYCQSKDNMAYCTVTQKQKPTNDLQTYLIEEYGVANAEIITKNIRHFEDKNEVKVLTEKEYTNEISLLNDKIENTENRELIHFFNSRIKCLKNLQDITYQVVPKIMVK